MSSILASQIGNASTLPGWPTNNLDGLFEALKRWPLDRRLDYSNDPQFAGEPGRAPFRGRAWGFCVLQYDAKLDKRVPRATRPIYPEHPDAVRYVGSFLTHAYAFWLDTDDSALIAKLDQAIAENLARQN